MKIISKGQPKQKTCPTCGCVFEYDIADIKHIKGLTFMNEETNVIYCPQCNERIDEHYNIAVNCLGHLK